MCVPVLFRYLKKLYQWHRILVQLMVCITFSIVRWLTAIKVQTGSAGKMSFVIRILVTLCLPVVRLQLRLNNITLDLTKETKINHNKMKARLYSLILYSAIVVLLTACGGSTKDEKAVHGHDDESVSSSDEPATKAPAAFQSQMGELFTNYVLLKDAFVLSDVTKVKS